LSGRGLCDELITRPEECYRLCCVVVCDLETSRMGAPYIYDISRLRVNFLFISFKATPQCPGVLPTQQVNSLSFPPNGATAPSGPRPPHGLGFTIPLRHTTFSRTPPDERSSCRGDLYPTTRNTHNRQTSIPPTGFATSVPVSERPQIHACHRAASGSGDYPTYRSNKFLYTLIPIN